MNGSIGILYMGSLMNFLGKAGSFPPGQLQKVSVDIEY
jgi:hypothetical protein